MSREVKITIGKDGKVKIDAEGFTGEGCKDLTKVLEEKLGVESSVKKPEYDQIDFDSNPLGQQQSQL